MLGVTISEGALVNIVMAACTVFAAQASAIRARLLAGTALQSDETGLRVGKKNWWLWVFHNADSAAFVADASRAKRVVEAFLGGFRPDYWVSDRYGGQLGWAGVDHQFCLAHLIRDAQYAEDCGDGVFATKLIHLLKRACRIGRRRQRLTDSTLKVYLWRLETALDAALALVPAHAAGEKLRKAVLKARPHLFVFMTNRDIPATNNESERSLRPAAVFRKVTNGFRTEWGVKFYADFRSVVETARRRSVGSLQAIRLTLAGKPLPLPA
jgi:transposase